MDNEILDKPKNLEAEIKEVNRQLNMWRKASAIRTIDIVGRGICDVEYCDPTYVNFPDLKVQVLATLQARLVQLEQEFKSL